MSEKCRIGVAHDSAFSFYYEDNFDLLREAGAELVFFSPLTDSALPPDLDALYFGGGFPEIHAPALSGNEGLKESVRKFYEEGGLIYGECGGLIYLVMLGLVPGEIRMTDRLQNFGYKELEAAVSTFLFPQGRKLRSHEFHYSVWEVEAKNFMSPYKIKNREDGFYDSRIFASYQHLHFGQDAELARSFVDAASRVRKREKTAKEGCYAP